MTTISEFAWSACSCVSASTSATGCPFQWMRRSCITGRSMPPAALAADMKSGIFAIFGALR